MRLLFLNGVCLHPLALWIIHQARHANRVLVIAYIFTFYILSFVIDLLPSVRTKHHVPQGEKRTEMAHSGPSAPHPGDPEVGVAYEPPAVTAASMEEASVVGPDHHRGQRM